jgi:regulator of replication initiation timing
MVIACNENLKKALHECIAKNGKLLAENIELKKDPASMAEQLCAQKAELESAQGELENTRSELENTRSELEKMRTENDEMKKTLAAFGQIREPPAKRSKTTSANDSPNEDDDIVELPEQLSEEFLRREQHEEL